MFWINLGLLIVAVVSVGVALWSRFDAKRAEEHAERSADAAERSAAAAKRQAEVAAERWHADRTPVLSTAGRTKVDRDRATNSIRHDGPERYRITLELLPQQEDASVVGFWDGDQPTEHYVIDDLPPGAVTSRKLV
jgi:hypothetical protein